MCINKVQTLALTVLPSLTTVYVPCLSASFTSMNCFTFSKVSRNKFTPRF